MLANPSPSGFSEKLTARNPRAALRRISSAASSGSASHGSWQGMKRSRSVAHHSSIIQSLYACSDASPSSGSCMRAKRLPAKPQSVEPKHSEAQIPATSMSARRVIGSLTEGRNSSYEQRDAPFHSSSTRPAAPFANRIGMRLSSRIHQGTPSSSVSTRGASAAYSAGMRPTNVCGGSSTWSSTDTIGQNSSSGSGSGMNVTVVVRCWCSASSARLLRRVLTVRGSAFVEHARVELDLLARHRLEQAGVPAPVDARASRCDASAGMGAAPPTASTCHAMRDRHSRLMQRA